MSLYSPSLAAHVALLCASYQHWTGASLLAARLSNDAAVRALADAPFAVLSHDTQPDPVFNYGNRLALNLFEMNWDEFTALPSRASAEAVNQAERARLLAQVSQHGYINDYSGIRIARSGRRFRISNAIIWNVLDAAGGYHGQAALIRTWQPLTTGTST